MKRENRLYNIIFPIWILWLIPITWLVVLPVNFLVDLLVVVITLKFLKADNVKSVVKSSIWKVWIFGFAADFIGTAFMFLAGFIEIKDPEISNWWWQNLAYGVNYNPFSSIYAFLYTTVCVIISGCCIYLFNYKISLRKADLPEDQIKKLALSLAVITAPYLFFLPTSLFFNY